ncbi:MAG TPA: tetratricopeptide repeat protein, partial [Kofleriaceae bacterium]|nr:tetratricopeptide repeat protein [Kofleriaceae bacterium]
PLPSRAERAPTTPPPLPARAGRAPTVPPPLPVAAPPRARRPGTASAPPPTPALTRAERAAALTEVARELRATGDHAGAARALDEACALLPDDVGLALDRDQARAAILIDRAADDARAGDAEGAERQLRGVLATLPHDADAHLALSQLLEEGARPAEAVDLLGALLDVRPDPLPREARARVVHRYAQLVGALGDADEAHQQLHEAHRLDRRNLLVTLALGDSCFQRRLWREASILLGSLAEHPDAPRHGAAVAAALVRAAQAEVRALRPANAESRLAAAVKLDPACAPAWHRLGELALERGDTRAAAGHMEREAAATTDPRERTRLYVAVGDLARDQLADLALAERSWMAIVDTAPAPTLEKLLAIQRRRGAGPERARVCERLADLAAPTDARARKELQEEATDAYAAAGDLPRAAALAAQLIAAHPLDVDTVACASAIALAAGDFESAAAWLGRALSTWDAPRGPDAADPRRAELWRRLGDARRARGDTSGARTAYERAVAADPESDGALAARRGLVELAAATGRTDIAALAGLVAAEQDPADVYAWARDRAAAGSDDARPLYDLSRALGASLTAVDEQLLAHYPPRVLAADQPYAAPLDDAERRALIDDEDESPLGELLAQLAEAAPLLCPSGPAALSAAGIAASAERLSATSDLAAAAIYPQIAKALGGPPTLLHATARRDAADVTILLAAPPVVVLGPRLATRLAPRADVDATQFIELRFHLGRAVELSRIHRCFAAGVPPERFAHFTEALRWALLHPDDEAPDAALAREAKRLRSTIPLLLRRRLAERIPRRAPLDPAGYLAACERAADRSGLLACGDVGVALRLAGGPATARHLVRLAASPRFLAARRVLWPAPRR